MPNTFPDQIFDEHGAPVNTDGPPLTKERVNEHPHGYTIHLGTGTAPVAQAWLLNDDATYMDLPAAACADAIRYILEARSILVLGKRKEQVDEVKNGLMGAFNLAAMPTDGMGRG